MELLYQQRWLISLDSLNTIHHTASQRGHWKCKKRGVLFFLKTSKAKEWTYCITTTKPTMQALNVLCLPQLIVQEWSWTVSSASFTTWFSCYLSPVRDLPKTASPTTNKWSPQWSLHPALVMTIAWTWTVVCSATVRMQVTALSYLWRFLKYAITSQKPVVITNHDKELSGYLKTIPWKMDHFQGLKQKQIQRVQLLWHLSKWQIIDVHYMCACDLVFLYPCK